MAEDQGDKAEEGEKKLTIQQPAKANPLLLVVLILILICMGGIAYMQYQQHVRASSQPSVRDLVKAQLDSIDPGEEKQPEDALANKKDQDGLLLPLDGFTANLAQGDGPRRYVKLNTVLKFSRDSKEEEFKARKPQIRDSIISILNAKRPSDLLKREGKEYLKEEIKAAINAFLVDGKVVDVFYVGFQIQ